LVCEQMRNESRHRYFDPRVLALLLLAVTERVFVGALVAVAAGVVCVPVHLAFAVKAEKMQVRVRPELHASHWLVVANVDPARAVHVLIRHLADTVLARGVCPALLFLLLVALPALFFHVSVSTETVDVRRARDEMVRFLDVLVGNQDASAHGSIFASRAVALPRVAINDVVC